MPDTPTTPTTISPVRAAELADVLLELANNPAYAGTGQRKEKTE